MIMHPINTTIKAAPKHTTTTIAEQLAEPQTFIIQHNYYRLIPIRIIENNSINTVAIQNERNGKAKTSDFFILNWNAFFMVLSA